MAVLSDPRDNLIRENRSTLSPGLADWYLMCPVSLRFGDHFEWNKVTSCIHNILSGQRWIEHYGEVLIRNTQDSSCHCKITFCKVGVATAHPGEVGGAPHSAPAFSTLGQVLEFQHP